MKWLLKIQRKLVNINMVSIGTRSVDLILLHCKLDGHFDIGVSLYM
jgi:hypothetical protein